MAFWDRFRRKDLSANDAFYYLFFGGKGRNKLPASEEAILQSHLIYRAVASIAQRLGALPYHLRDLKGNIDERAEKVFSNISKDFTFTEILEKTVSFQCLSGYHVWYVENNVITPIDSNLITLERNQFGEWKVTPLWNYNIAPIQDNFVVFPNFTPYNSYVGISELKTAIDVANLGENAITLTNNIMNKGGLIQGILGTDQEITAEQAKQAKDAFDSKYSGIDNTGGVAVFGKGLKWQKIGLSPSDFSALDLMKVTLEGISIAFGVPKIFLMNTESVDYANSKTQEKIFYEVTIKPKADRLADRINRFVLPKLNMKNLEFSFDWSSVEALKSDRLVDAQIEEINIRSGTRTINEIRDDKGLAPVPWGNDFWAPLSQTSFGTYEQQKMERDIIELKNLIIDSKKKDYEEMKWKLFISRTTPQEQKLAKEIQKYFKKQGEYVISELEKRAKGLTPDDLVPSFLPLDARADLIKLLKNYLISFMQQAGDALIAEYDLAISFNVMIPQIQTWLKDRLEKTALEMTQTTERDLYDTLLDGINEGEGIPSLSKRVRTLFEETYKNRSKTIARTEVIGANNKAQIVCAQEGGMNKKTWLTALDERTREWHAEANGQTVNIDEPFIVMGEKLEEPGDTNGSPENIINCRCTCIFGRE